MDGGKLKHKQEMQPKARRSSPLATNNPSDVSNGYAGENSSQNQAMYLGVSHFSASSPLVLGTSGTLRNFQGLENGKKSTRGSISEATGPRPQTRESGKKKEQKGPNNTNGLKSQSRENDQFVPTANVVRIMRKGLPGHAKVADEAKEMMQECVSEFISFLTSDANESCKKEHRKTVTAEDLLGAMSRLGFDHYVEPLAVYLQKYRESEMLPMITRSNVPYGSNTGPGYGPPTFVSPAVVPPQYAMFGSPGNGVYYPDGSVPASETQKMGEDSVSAGNVVYYHDRLVPARGTKTVGQNSGSAATVPGGNGQSLGLGIKEGQSGDDGREGSPGLSRARMDFFDLIGKYE